MCITILYVPLQYQNKQTMKTYKITYLDYQGKERIQIEYSALSSNYVKAEFIENFTEATFLKIELI